MKISMKIICMCLLGIMMTYGVRAQSSRYIEQQKREVKHVAEKKKICNITYPIRIATSATNPPFGWTEAEWDKMKQKDKYLAKGYNIDLLSDLFKSLDVWASPVAFTNDTDALNGLENGRVDVFIGAYYDPRYRKMGYTYIIPSYFQNVAALIFLKGKEKEFTSFQDLKGLKGVVRSDELFYTYVRPSLPSDVYIEEVPSSREAFTRLINGRADYILGSPYSAEAEARRFKLNTKITMVKTPLPAQEMFIVFGKNAPCRAAIPELVKKMKEHQKHKVEETQKLISYINTWGQRFKNEPGLEIPNTPADNPDTQHNIPDQKEETKITK